jgi:NitT/TauT family transport system ATP-binding protein
LRDFFVPADRHAAFPWKSHALWLYTQMVSWGQVEHSAQQLETARQTYRPDIYRAALAGVDHDIPDMDMKSERFFDNKRFDPHELVSWLRRREL